MLAYAVLIFSVPSLFESCNKCIQSCLEPELLWLELGQNQTEGTSNISSYFADGAETEPTFVSMLMWLFAWFLLVENNKRDIV